ncbi:MAG: penicillin-binding protein 2 [Bacteroidales bacterium]|nr:penicillin-binding protein 2 [Bacteroidales bacterium]
MKESVRHIRMMVALAVAALILLGRIFYIQLMDDSYKTDALNNSMAHIPVYPLRGIIYDRNGRILVGNKICYDLLCTPTALEPFDTLLLSRVLEIEPDIIKKKLAEYTSRKSRRKIGYRSVVMFPKLPEETYMRFEEISYRFPGFSGQARSLRQYPYNAGGNLLGYISEVDAAYIKAHPEYKSGDYAGKTGLESSCERLLRGEKGEKIFYRDSRGRIGASYRGGEADKPAVSGMDITTTIDARLQHYGQQLMKNKVGSLVAIEPSTGEILTLVSSPGIDVECLADIGSHYKEIAANPYKPMFNRAVQASYPPGSVFKLVNALIGLQEGVLKPSMLYPCHAGYHFGKSSRLGCHNHRSPINMDEAIMMSCNAYFCYVFKDLIDNPAYGNSEAAFSQWRAYVESFGFGKKLGSDFPSELGGFIPQASYYDRYYGKNAWKAHTILSLSIGQGELGCTPLHLANLCATLANRGYYYIPHLVKGSGQVPLDEKYRERHYTLIDTTHFAKLIPGMFRAVNAGLGSGATAGVAAVGGLEICGKTGTAQNPHGDDHSVFICFAPRDNPKIAVAAYIENGGFGAAWAAPVASLLVEQYLTGGISEERKPLEKRVLEGNLMNKVKTK